MVKTAGRTWPFSKLSINRRRDICEGHSVNSVNVADVNCVSSRPAAKISETPSSFTFSKH